MAGWSASITFGEPLREDGLHLIQGVAEKWPKPDLTVVPADRGGSACHQALPGPHPRRQLGYWRNEHEDAEGADGFICLSAVSPPKGRVEELYVTLEFFETEPGWIAVQFVRARHTEFLPHVCTWENAADPWDDTWVSTADTNTWQTATIRLVRPALGGLGPFSADVKIVSSAPLYLRKATLSTTAPKDFEKTNRMAHADRIERIMRPRFPKASVPVSIGNICAIFGKDDAGEGVAVAPLLPVYRAMGFTALQSYVRWSAIEAKEGVWDWTRYDWVVSRCRELGMRWIAFIMIGPWYAMPQWWLDSPNNYPNKCLEHDEVSWVQSIWSPVMLDYVDRFMTKFAEHYPEEIIESIMVGIAGDFGESTTNGVFNKNTYHTHVGYWCGEDVAVADLRKTMKAQYGTVAKLNAAWGTGFASFDELRPVLREAASDRRWLDQTGWYVDRMTWWMEQWGNICRKALPNTLLFNAAGGAGDPPRGAHWTDQTRALKPSGMGQRVTNEGADYAFNYAYTAWQAVCCRFYGVPFGNEPWGGDMCGTGVLGRMYNAITAGATNFWFYEGHVRPPAGRLAVERALPFMDGSIRRTNRVAVWYPWTHFVLVNDHGFSEHGLRDKFWPQIEELRDIVDFDFVDDGLVQDGIMSDYDFLVVMQGTRYRADELERIVKWVEKGGVLITHNIGVPSTVDGDTSLGEKLLAFPETPTKLETELGARIARVGKGRVVMFPRCADLKGYHGDPRWPDDHPDHPATHVGFWTMLTNTLANASKLGATAKDYPVIDGEQNEVYGALCERHGKQGILYFSQTKSDVTVCVRIPGRKPGSVTIPAGQLRFVTFDEIG